MAKLRLKEILEAIVRAITLLFMYIILSTEGDLSLHSLLSTFYSTFLTGAGIFYFLLTLGVLIIYGIYPVIDRIIKEKLGLSAAERNNELELNGGITVGNPFSFASLMTILPIAAISIIAISIFSNSFSALSVGTIPNLTLRTVTLGNSINVTFFAGLIVMVSVNIDVQTQALVRHVRNRVQKREPLRSIFSDYKLILIIMAITLAIVLIVSPLEAMKFVLGSSNSGFGAAVTEVTNKTGVASIAVVSGQFILLAVVNVLLFA